MKRKIAIVAATAFIMTTLPAYQCGKQEALNYTINMACNVSRTAYKEIVNEEGIIVQSSDGSFAIRFNETNPARSILGLPCQLNSMNVPGSRVVVSGALKNLNTNEYISADFKSSNCFFLEISKIVIKF